MIGMPLVISVLYVWCQVNHETVVQFWFGTQFKAMYLPWALAGFNVLLGGKYVTRCTTHSDHLARGRSENAPRIKRVLVDGDRF